MTMQARDHRRKGYDRKLVRCVLPSLNVASQGRDVAEQLDQLRCSTGLTM